MAKLRFYLEVDSEERTGSIEMHFGDTTEKIIEKIKVRDVKFVENQDVAWVLDEEGKTVKAVPGPKSVSLNMTYEEEQ